MSTILSEITKNKETILKTTNFNFDLRVNFRWDGRPGWARRLNEGFLPDGREYTLLVDYDRYYLVFGGFVLQHWNAQQAFVMERLVRTGAMFQVRPELMSNSASVPEYKVSVFGKYQEHMIRKATKLTAIALPLGDAIMYASTVNRSIYLRYREYIYMFKSQKDCDHIISLLLTVKAAPVEFDWKFECGNLLKMAQRLVVYKTLGTSLYQHGSSSFVKQEDNGSIYLHIA
jgi:hypothetical protein